MVYDVFLIFLFVGHRCQDSPVSSRSLTKDSGRGAKGKPKWGHPGFFLNEKLMMI
jgi:hypothetical protein